MLSLSPELDSREMAALYSKVAPRVVTKIVSLEVP